MDLLARSKLHAYCVVSHFLSARAELHAYYILYHVILIFLQSDWRCQHSGRAHEKCA